MSSKGKTQKQLREEIRQEVHKFYKQRLEENNQYIARLEKALREKEEECNRLRLEKSVLESRRSRPSSYSSIVSPILNAMEGMSEYVNR